MSSLVATRNFLLRISSLPSQIRFLFGFGPIHSFNRFVFGFGSIHSFLPFIRSFKMRFTTLAAIASVSLFTSAAPAAVPHVVHERRDLHQALWTRSDIKIDRRSVVPVSIGLKQRNLENGHQYLMDVSSPTSANYGKHWSPKEVSLD